MSKPSRTRRTAKGGASRCSSTKATWLMVGCAFVAVGIVTVMPKVGGARNNFMYRNQEPDVSTTFSGVRIPAETVPVALGRTIGSRNDETPLDVQVFLCNLDRNTYFHKPYKYPMFKDLVRLSGGCTGQFSTATSLSQLQLEIDANPDNYLEPTGFVFHMSRCGSTLAANLMGSSPYNLVYSESKPPAQLMSVCDTGGCSEDQRVQALRTIIRAMGKTSFHKHMFFKFQSSNSKLIDYFRMAFPDTPWIFVYREPVPVLMSLLGFKDGKMGATSSSSPCLRTKQNPSQKTADFLSMTKAEAKSASSEDYCAAHLATLLDGALSSLSAAGVEDGADGVAVDYETLPEAIAPIMADVFGAPLTPAEEYYAKEISGWYSKSRAGVHSFTPDTKAKEERATPKVTEAAERILLPFYDRLGEVSLRKESIPAELALGYTPDNSRRELSDEEFEATPVHMRGLDRVVDPLAPEWMASSVWNSAPIEPFECPDEPPENYPKGFPAIDVINHWNPDVTDQVPDTHYLSTCRFDYQREMAKAERYRQAEKPFILYNIPSVDATAGRWSDPDYMEKILGPYTKYATEHSVNNHFMYFNHKVAKEAKRGYDHGLNLTDWKPPTDSVNLSYRQWLDLAKTHGKGGGEHWYFRVGDANNKMILKEMPIFQKPAGGGGNIFLVEPRGQRGIHCRFGMPGVIAEAHFDGSRNMVAMISGVRRWIMSHPNQCETMYLLPHGHPSGRHSEVDWSNPDLQKFPEFPRTLISEVLLKAGEVLYVPTHWFHYISNIGINAQCNSRSGVAYNYDQDLDKCGFGTSHPRPQSKKSQHRPHYL